MAWDMSRDSLTISSQKYTSFLDKIKDSVFKPVTLSHRALVSTAGKIVPFQPRSGNIYSLMSFAYA